MRNLRKQCHFSYALDLNDETPMTSTRMNFLSANNRNAARRREKEEIAKRIKKSEELLKDENQLRRKPSSE